LPLIKVAEGGFNLEFFKALPVEDRKDYLARFTTFLDEGKTRAVFDLGDGRVLKLGNPSTNRSEARTSRCLAGSAIVAHVLDVAEDYSWVTMEKVETLKPGRFFRIFTSALGLPKPLALRHQLDIFYLYHQALNGPLDYGPEHTARYQHLLDNPTPWWIESLRAIKTCGMRSDDMHSNNFGLLNGNLVLLDYA
jgi:hypothetical protein